MFQDQLENRFSAPELLLYDNIEHYNNDTWSIGLIIYYVFT